MSDLKRGDGAYQLVQLFGYFFAAYPVRSVAMLLAITAAALAEGVGIAALLPLIGLVIGVEGGGALTDYVARGFALFALEPALGGLTLFIIVAIGLKSLLLLLAMSQVGYSAAHAAMHLRLTAVQSLLDARWRHFVDQRAGDLASAVSIEPERAATAYVDVCRMLATSIQLLIYAALSVAISWRVSVSALVVGALAIVALGRLITWSRRAGQGQTNLQKAFMTRFLQGLDGMKPLKAMAREGSMKPLMEADIRGLNRVKRTMVISRAGLVEANEFIRGFAVVGGLYVFVTIWAGPPDGLLVLAVLCIRILQKVGHLQSEYQSAATNQPAFAFLQSTIAAAERAREPGLGSKAPSLSEAISLRDVSFSYGRGNVLDCVSMSLPAGAFVAIVGSSGVGKTTVADLIIGLIRPLRGEVWIDNLPMHDIDIRAWRNMIGYVPQETFLFHDTVMANVTLGDPAISRAEVETALRRAEAWEFVAALAEGMDSMVGERGARLSGGQRQRIAIARALIRDPTLLILDEATTALDPDTEASIIATIRRLADNVTVLAISHQPAMRDAAQLVYSLSGAAATLETDELQMPERGLRPLAAGQHD